MTLSGYFILATTVELGMGITYGKLLLCHGISDGSVEKKFSTREYNRRTVYDCFNNNFSCDFGSPDLNLSPIDINGRPHQDKISRYTPHMLPADIYVASEKYFITFNIPYD